MVVRLQTLQRNVNIAGGTLDVSLRTRGPFMIFLTVADDYDCCTPSIVLLSETGFYVKNRRARKRTSGVGRQGEERTELIIEGEREVTKSDHYRVDSRWLVIARMTLRRPRQKQSRRLQKQQRA